MIVVKFSVTLLLFFMSCQSIAGGWSNAATPTRIDIERGGGLMIYGGFGNPGNCVVSGRIYIEIDHPQYEQVYAMVLMAYASGKKIQAYSHHCKPVGWYSVTSTTYNVVAPYGAVNIMN